MLRSLASALLILCPAGAMAQTATEVAGYQRAVDALQAGDGVTALAEAERASPIARDIIAWHLLRSGAGDFETVRAFLARNGDWPGLKLLRRVSEAVVPVGTSPDAVIDFFRDQPPQTGAGAVALVEAYRAKGLKTEAQDAAISAWRTMILNASDESVLLATYGTALAPYHEDRLDMLLWRNAGDAAERMYPRVDEGHRALARARLALRGNDRGVDALIAKVPALLADDPGLAFERMQWRARKGRNDDAIALILDRRPADLGEPERWAGWRIAFARSEMRAGHGKTAYRLAAEHGLMTGGAFAELEWLAGYIALTERDDPATALRHFMRFRAAVDTPISLGRAAYWEGRAHEALGDLDDAQAAYAFGAEYQTSFYGLLAAERAGRTVDPDLRGTATYPDWRDTDLGQSRVFAAARLFIAAGQRSLAEQFLRHLAETASADEIGAMGDYVLAAGEPHLAVMIAKEAAQRGITLTRPYFPVVDLNQSALPVPRELALAIARRESEFDPNVVSGVGARGLMQIMPATARHVARTLSIDFDKDRLISDPAYNTRLGTAYLDELMQIFDGNVVLVAAAYNAGPGRVAGWIDDRGDPRRPGVDVIDWIESIPFDETRNYVMRVAESLPVYRARLTGHTGPLHFLDELTATPGHERQAMGDDPSRPRARPELAQ